MASILDRYGIKEVADVMFYTISDEGQIEKPVLYLDTLKVSTIEQTAEQADARGGKGNPKLITWDYGKEITVTLEDALFSAKSMAIMFGNGQAEEGAEQMTRMSVVRATENALPGYFSADCWPTGKDTANRYKINMTDIEATGQIPFDFSNIVNYTVYDETGAKVVDTSTDISGWTSASDIVAGQKYFVKYTVTTAKQKVITITGDSFPGTYYVTGDTYARSDVSGKDQFFQFIIPKAKITSENTITLEAEGDPSTFSMNLTVLRPEDGEMMKLVQYDISTPSEPTEGLTISPSTMTTTGDVTVTGGDSKIRAISSNTSVATVSVTQGATLGNATVTVTKVAAGTATITISDSNETKTCSCTFS